MNTITKSLFIVTFGLMAVACNGESSGSGTLDDAGPSTKRYVATFDHPEVCRNQIKGTQGVSGLQDLAFNQVSFDATLGALYEVESLWCVEVVEIDTTVVAQPSSEQRTYLVDVDASADFGECLDAITTVSYVEVTAWDADQRVAHILADAYRAKLVRDSVDCVEGVRLQEQ